MATGLNSLEPTDLDHRLRAAEAVVREAGRLAAEDARIGSGKISAKW